MNKLLIWISLVLLLILLIMGWILYLRSADISNTDVQESVLAESQTIQVQVDTRCNVLEGKIDRLEAKLDRIESKLDRLIEMATPKLPDGMTPAGN